jgi:hypothetical protein
MAMGSHVSTTGRSRRAPLGIGIGLATLVAAATLMPPAPAQAADPAEAVVQRMIELNRQALTAFAAQDYETARSALTDAVKQGKDAGLADDKMMARTYLHLGAVYIDGLKDRTRGLRFLGLALRLRPDIKITPSLVTPTLEAAFAEAKAEGQNGGAVATPAAGPEPRAEPKAEPAAAPPEEKTPAPAEAAAEEAVEQPDDGEPDIPATIPQPLYCPNPDEAPPGESIFLRCVVKSEIQAARMLLFYRLAGDERFLASKMSRSPRGWWSGSIPAKAVTGKSVQYYVEARDSSGQESATNGRNDSPNLMLVREGAPSLSEGTLAGTRVGVRRRRSRASDDENPLEAQERERERSSGVHRRGPRSFWIGLGLGTAYGWHRATRLEFRTDLKVESGLAAAGLLYLAPEVGYQFTSSFGVSIQGRHQFIPEQKSDFLDSHEGSPARGAHSVLAKGSYYLGAGNLQLMLSGIFGGGEGFRLVIPPKPTMDPMTTLNRNDTVRGGPFVIGAAATVLYHFSPHAALALELKGLGGFPDSGRVADFGLGMQFGL